MIRHHHEGDKTVKCADPVAIQNGPGDASGDLRLSEPDGTQRSLCELAVGFNEGASVADRAQWQRAMESKGNEECCSLGLKMGKVTAVFHVIVVVSSVEISHRLKPVPPHHRRCQICSPCSTKYDGRMGLQSIAPRHPKTLQIKTPLVLSVVRELNGT